MYIFLIYMYFIYLLFLSWSVVPLRTAGLADVLLREQHLLLWTAAAAYPVVAVTSAPPPAAVVGASPHMMPGKRHLLLPQWLRHLLLL